MWFFIRTLIKKADSAPNHGSGIYSNKGVKGSAMPAKKSNSLMSLKDRGDVVKEREEEEIQ